MEAELRWRIQTVIIAREKAAAAQAHYDAAYSNWEYANSNLIDEKDEAKEALAGAELMLRGLTVAVYQETQNKAPYPGVGIREVTKIDYPAQEAFAWAMEHKICLQLDVKAFEKLLTTASELRPSFVTVTKEPQGTIATKLELKEK